jgi:hypothetical protein
MILSQIILMVAQTTAQRPTIPDATILFAMSVAASALSFMLSWAALSMHIHISSSQGPCASKDIQVDRKATSDRRPGYAGESNLLVIEHCEISF